MEFHSSKYLPKSKSDSSGFVQMERRSRSNVTRELATANHDTLHRRVPSAPNSSYSLTPVPQQKVQLVLIGDRNVGKTCVLERFTENMFHDDLVSTVGIDFKLKTVSYEDQMIRLQIWDTAGQERFNSITTAYYRGARGVIVMYDVTRNETFLNLVNWLNLVEEYGRSDAVIAIVGNKSDVRKNRVDSHKARKFAEERGYMFFETSAKSSFNIENVFLNLIKEILKQFPKPKDNNHNEQTAAAPPRVQPETTQSTKNTYRLPCCQTG